MILTLHTMSLWKTGKIIESIQILNIHNELRKLTRIQWTGSSTLNDIFELIKEVIDHNLNDEMRIHNIIDRLVQRNPNRLLQFYNIQSK